MRREPLIGRETQIGKFSDILDRISRNGPVSSNILEYYGPTGIGKTTLLNEVRQLSGMYHAFVDYERIDSESLMVNPIILLNYISKHLGTVTDGFIEKANDFEATKLPDKGVVRAYGAMDQETRLFQRPDWLTKFRDLDVEFIKGVNQKKVASVLLFDNSDSAPIELLNFMEEWVINPLSQIKQVVVVHATERPHRWMRPEIRRRLTSEELKPFNKEQVGQMLNSQLSGVNQAYIDQIYQITGGHPGAIQAVIK